MRAPLILPDKVNSPACENDCMNGNMSQVKACDVQYMIRHNTGNTFGDTKLRGSLQYLITSDSFVFELLSFMGSCSFSHCLYVVYLKISLKKIQLKFKLIFFYFE